MSSLSLQNVVVSSSSGVLSRVTYEFILIV